MHFKGCGNFSGHSCGYACAAIVAALAALAQTKSAVAQIPCRYDVEIIPNVNCGIIGQGPMILSAINNHGEVIGWSLGCGEPGQYRSYTWLSGPTLTQLPVPPGAVGFRAADLNDNGLICGIADIDISQSPPATLIVQRAYVYNRKTNVWTQIPPVNTQIGWSSAAALNNAGLVVGSRGIGNDFHGGPHNAFIFDSNTGIITDLGVMNGPNSGAMAVSENGIVVGWTGTGYLIPEDARAFLHASGSTAIVPAIPNGLNSNGVGVNSNAQVLVIGVLDQPGPLVSRTSVYQSGNTQPLAVPPGFDRLFASSITETGLIAGGCNTIADSTPAGFLWLGTHFESINSLVPSSAGFTRLAVSRINENKFLIGGAFLGDQMINVRLMPRPTIAGDATCDEFVNVNDLLAVINSWGPCNGCHADLDHNGAVSVWDLFIVVQNWGNSS